MPVLETTSTLLRRCLTTNYATATFPSIVPTKTEPSGDGVFNAGILNGAAQNFIKLLLFGTGSDNNTFSVRVYSWDFIQEDDFNKKMWIPSLLCELAATIDTDLVGLAGKAVVATEYFADTILITTGEDGVSVTKTSPADGVSIASAKIDIEGAQKIQFTFKADVASGANGVWKYFG